MKITIDTKEDSHEDIKKVISMLKHVVGDNVNDAIISNQPEIPQANPMADLFGAATQLSANMQEQPQAANEEIGAKNEPVKESNSASSTDDLFAELFNEDELKKLDFKNAEDDDDPRPPSKSPYTIEFY